MSCEAVIRLSEEKDLIEKEIEQLVHYLTAPGMPGLKGPLIDSEGFPLAGVDLYAVRDARQKYNRLNNDHSDLMNRIEKELHAYFGNPSNAEGNPERLLRSEIAVSVKDKPVPFAEITEVSERSPASLAGFQVFDKVISFGTVNYLNSNGLAGLQDFVKGSEGREVDVVVLRGEVVVRMAIRPGRWEGNGIIGCRFRGLN